MTFRPYSGKVRLGDSDIFLDISNLPDGYVLSRDNLEIVATLIGQDKLDLDMPQNPSDAATKEYVDQLVDSEEAARISGDGYLQAQIDNIVSNIDPAALDSLTEIVSAFQSADGSLLDTVNNLAASASAALASEAAERAAQDGYLASDLSDEMARAMAAESALGSDLANEISRASDAEGLLQDSIDSEVARAIAAESGLHHEIVSEASARSAADSTEQAARIAGDTSLQSAISAEISRATSAEQGLQSQITSIISNTDPTSLDSLAEIVDAFQAADGDLLSAINSLSVSANSALQAEVTRATTAETLLQSNLDSEAAARAAADALKLNLSGGTMSGPIAMGGSKVTGLANGTAPSDAVNLAQLQSAISNIDPAGSVGQLQFNKDGYDFGASADLAWDDSEKALFVGGVLSLGEEADLPSAEAGVGKLVAKDDNGLYFVDSSGTNHYVLTDGMVELSGTSIALDTSPELPVYRTVTMTGTTTFTTTNLGAGRSISLRLVAGSSTRGVFFPNDWKWLAGSVPASIPAGKVAMLSLVAYGTSDSDVVAGWSYTDSTSISGSGTAGQVAFFNGTRSVSSESNLRWDSTNDRLIVGLVPTPSANVHVAGTAQIEGAVVMNGAVTIGDAGSDTVTVNGSATFNSPVSLGSNKITDVASPSDDKDAVNLAFLESRRLLAIQVLSASGNIGSDKDVVFITGSGGSVVRLPLATSVNNGKVVVIKKRNGGSEDVIGTALGSGQAIDGVAADGLSGLQQLFLLNESVTLISDGNDWYVI
jgi:hypothetical protein